MKSRCLFFLSLAYLLSPLTPAQEPPVLMSQLQGMLAPQSSQLSAKARGKFVSALGVLPADTDSFFVLTQVGKTLGMTEAVAGQIPGIELARELDSLAVGLSSQAAQDLTRLKPLFQVLSRSQESVSGQWLQNANDDAARAIVGVQREQMAADGEKLVQASRDFHLAPVYLTLTANPGGEMLLRQLSVLPLMLPMSTDSSIEMTVRSGWRGFCVKGDLLDLSESGLAPQHEKAVMSNLQKARLYVLARVVDGKLVFVVCSNPDEINLPDNPGKSLLGAPRIEQFDSFLKRDLRALGFCSADVVKLREDMNLFEYLDSAGFMGSVFTRLAEVNETYAAAAAAVKSLLSLAAEVLPAKPTDERVVVWGDKELYVYLTSSAGNQQFVPGTLRHSANVSAPETALYAEFTPVAGIPQVDVGHLIDDVEKVQKGYLSTLKQQTVEKEQHAGLTFCQHKEALKMLLTGIQKWNEQLTGSGTLVLRESSEGAASAVAVTLLGTVNDADTAKEIQSLLGNGCRELCGDAAGDVSVNTVENDVIFTYGSQSSEMMASPVSVPGGGLFAVNFRALSRVLNRIVPGAECADVVQGVADMVQCVQGAMFSQEGQQHTLLKIIPSASTK